MGITEIKEILKKHKAELENKYHISEIGIFGSYVKNEQTHQSDVDILVDFSAPISLFEFINIEEELSKALNRKVDLVSRNALKPHIGKHILAEVQMI